MKKTTGIKKEKAVRAAFAAVFVLLAVLCVFAGAGAAETEVPVEGEVLVLGAGFPAEVELGSGPISLGDVEVWKLYKFSDTIKDYVKYVNWTAEGGTTVQFLEDPHNEGCYYIGEGTTKGYRVVDGTYSYSVPNSNLTFSINVKHLGAPTGYIVDKNGLALKGLNGNAVDKSSFNIKVESVTAGLFWVNPDDTLRTTNPEYLGFGSETNNVYEIEDVNDLGVYTVYTAVLLKDVKGIYASVAPEVILGDAISFEIYDARESMTLTASADEIIQGNRVAVTLEAPYGDYTVSVENGTIPAGQAGVVYNGSGVAEKIKVGIDGIRIFTVQSINTDDVKVTVEGNNLKKSVTIKVVPGRISATAVPAVTNIGNEIHIEGTNELGGELALFMKGENYFKQIVASGTASDKIAVALNKTITGKEFDVTLKTGNLRADAGYYTLYLAKLTGTGTISGTDDFANSEKCSVCTTIAIKLVPSFISITEMPTYAVFGEEFIISGVAEGQPDEVMWYAFGTNFFKTGTAPVRADNTYRISFYPQHNEMDAGQYILVIQHPMYDKKFNVGPKGNAIYLNKNGSFMDGDATLLFTVDPRQTINAARALCDIIDSEDIDDMYVKRSFDVVGASSVIMPIPEKISQGETLTISGRAIGYQGGVATVTFQDSTGATALSMGTNIREDGTWEIDCGTASLACGDYTIYVYVGSLEPATAEISIVKGPVTQITYKLTDPESVSGGPLQIIGKETVVHYPAALNQDDTEFKRGDSVKATLQVHIPQGAFMNMGDKIYFDTDLTGASWAVSLHSGNTKLWESHIQYPDNYISGFDVTYPYNVDLYITLTGYVPAGNKDKISVMKVSTTATGGNGVKSFNVLMNNSIPHADLTLQNGWNFISVPKKLADKDKNNTAGKLFANVDTDGKAILSYNAQTKQWTQVTDSTVISPLNAYWIYSTEKLTLNPAFDTTPAVLAVKSVYTGWNAVGASAEEPVAAKAAFTGVNWRSYTLWNADSQKYGTIYIKDGTGQYSDEQYIPLYKGGWLYMDGNGTINGYA